jgi:hypothetical protein
VRQRLAAGCEADAEEARHEAERPQRRQDRERATSLSRKPTTTGTAVEAVVGLRGGLPPIDLPRPADNPLCDGFEPDRSTNETPPPPCRRAAVDRGDESRERRHRSFEGLAAGPRPLAAAALAGTRMTYGFRWRNGPRRTVDGRAVFTSSSAGSSVDATMRGAPATLSASVGVALVWPRVSRRRRPSGS